MAEMNKKDDRTQAPKSRPRPEVKRPTIPPPGGLPLPPSRHQHDQQPAGFSLAPSRQQSVPPSSSLLLGTENMTSNIETPRAAAPRPAANPPLSGTMPIDLFGLPDLRFSIPSTSTTRFGFSETGFSSIKSPKHLPGIANVKVPNLFGNLSSRSGIADSNFSSAIQLPRPPIARSRDQADRDLHRRGVSSEEDLTRRAKRPTDLPLRNAIGTNLPNDPCPNDIPETSNFPSSRISKEAQKSSNVKHTCGRELESDNPNIPTSPIPGPSGAESNPESNNSPGTTAMNLPSTSQSIHLPGPSSNAASSDHHSLQPSRDLPGPSGIRRTGDSTPSIDQHPDAPPKSKSMLGKFKRFVRKGLSVKKKTGGPEDEEESAGLVFERDEDGQEPPPQPRVRDPDDLRYRPLTTEDYNYMLDRDPFIPNQEIEKKCYVCENTQISSPTISMISDTNTSKSDPDQESIFNSATQTPEPISRSNPASSGTERTCRCHLSSETSEQTSSNPTPEISESASAGDPIADTSQTASMMNPIVGTSESASSRNPITNTSETASASNPLAKKSESISNAEYDTPKPMFKK